MPEKPHVAIYTESNVAPNPGFGGWGVVLINTDLPAHDSRRIRELLGGECKTTQNRMELLAVLQGLRVLKKPCVVYLYTKSQYVKRGITAWLEGWLQRDWHTVGKEPVKNQDLWQALHHDVQQHEMHWEWEPSDEPYHEHAQQLAEGGRLAAIERYKKLQNSDGRE